MITHGDSEGTGVRRDLSDRLIDMEMIPAMFDRYISYYEPYATSHRALDRDQGLMNEPGNAAKSLMRAVTEMRAGRKSPGEGLESPRPK